MTLLDDFVDNTEDAYESYPTHSDIAHEFGAKQVAYEILDTLRWGHLVEYIYQRDDEFVRVIYEEGSGDSEYPYLPSFTAVKPVTKTVTVYEAV